MYKFGGNAYRNTTSRYISNNNSIRPDACVFSNNNSSENCSSCAYINMTTNGWHTAIGKSDCYVLKYKAVWSNYRFWMYYHTGRMGQEKTAANL